MNDYEIQLMLVLELLILMITPMLQMKIISDDRNSCIVLNKYSQTNKRKKIYTCTHTHLQICVYPYIIHCINGLEVKALDSVVVPSSTVRRRNCKMLALQLLV